jgi:ribosomal protein S18 acetylase RimI-like enzyme
VSGRYPNRRIVVAPAVDEAKTLRELFREYQRWLNVDLCFQNFEAELAGLPGAYTPPRGGAWIARVDGKVAGCIALRPLDEGQCEMKRLWVRPDYRGLGLGRRLAEVAIRAACEAHYQAMCLDTLGQMSEAHALYDSLGFVEIPAYYDNPLDDVRYLRLELADYVPTPDQIVIGPL